ncbi:putative MPP superfamily phosphohydrolase [Kitasatospora sp. MAA4]|uniref:metallophosphoesterase n=1 Tax=Kitasatospora sp. MAA4 TaxID=3035093 RepID=UPI0024755F48|nr:metallophosphoesterase [Kitasatospora sp. MAA4]MDH6132681.1 putative MPP superfamily phosphohydrolase [Kitasatospora sp. MAA4]
MRKLYSVPLGIAATGAACLTYSLGYEVRSFRLRRVQAAVLPKGAKPVRVLQVSDIHMVVGQRKKQRWLQSLAGLRPDLVVNTGDNLSDPLAVPAALDALGPLMEFPGVYVFGSNDYYGPTPKSPTRYLKALASGNHGLNNADGTGRHGITGAIHNPWEKLRDGFDAAGWLDLTNTRGRLPLNGLDVEFTGLDDPHIRRDRYAEVSGGPSADADLSIGIVHAPYLRSLDAFTADGYPLVLAGHTHGGQLCIPFYGALVTNCDLDTKRVKGLSTHRAGGREAYLHVSAGCGTNRYTPVRFACPPEATLLTLTPRP